MDGNPGDGNRLLIDSGAGSIFEVHVDSPSGGRVAEEDVEEGDDRFALEAEGDLD